MITIVQDEADYLYQFSEKLEFRMPVIMSNFDAGVNNELSDGQCSNTCSNSQAKFSNFKWTSEDSIVDPDEEPDQPDEPDEPELVIGEIASSIDMCTEEGCSACSMAHWSNDPSNEFPTCTNFIRYKF